MKEKIYTFKGAIQCKRGRYYWLVRLPGESDRKFRSLRQLPGYPAVTDEGLARDLAQKIWDAAMREAANPGIIKTIGELKSAYLKHIATSYREKSDMPQRIEYALNAIVPEMLTARLEMFGPRMLKNIRDRIVKQPHKSQETRKVLSLSFVNEQVNFIIQMFEWAAQDELIASEIPYSLRLVKPLRGTSSGVKIAQKRQPVDFDVVAKTLPCLSSVVAAMVKIQIYGAMRPSELMIMRPMDIEMSSEVWIYRPDSHKTEHLGTEYEREIPLGKQAQSILVPFIANRGASEYLFSPSESVEEFEAAKLANRKTPADHGNSKGTNNKGTRKLGDHYTKDSYRQAILRAVKRYNAGKKDNEKIKPWTPYQLRHTAATHVRGQFGDDGLEVVQAFLGQRSFDVAERYAQVRRKLSKKAADAMSEIEL